jgi:hypothetical protein
MNRALAIVSLLILSPTFLVLPLAIGAALALPSRLVASFGDPTALLQQYHGQVSLQTARYYEFLGAFWLWGYFLMVIAYFSLLAPYVRRWALAVWTVSIAYYCILLLTQPWQRPVWGVTFVSGPQRIALAISALMFVVSILGLCMSLLLKPSPRFSSQLPPPLPRT